MSRMNRPVKLALLTLGTGAAVAAFSLSSPSPAVAQPATAAAPASSSATFSVDAVHSSVIFKIKHMGVSNFYGTFKDTSGTFSLGDSASVDVTVKADSVDSRNSKRDDHIKSPDFFNAKEFPNITFKASGIKKGADGAYAGKGDLTFRGVTKPVTLTITPTGTGKGQGGKEIAGFETRFTIKRSDFGNSSMVGPLSDEVDLIVALEGSSK